MLKKRLQIAFLNRKPLCTVWMVCSPAKSHKPSLNRKMVFNCYAPQLSFSMVQALHTGFSFSSLSFQMGHSYVSHSPYPVNEDRLFPSFAISNSLFPPLHSGLCIFMSGELYSKPEYIFWKIYKLYRDINKAKWIDKVQRKELYIIGISPTRYSRLARR